MLSTILPQHNIVVENYCKVLAGLVTVEKPYQYIACITRNISQDRLNISIIVLLQKFLGGKIGIKMEGNGCVIEVTRCRWRSESLTNMNTSSGRHILCITDIWSKNLVTYQTFLELFWREILHYVAAF